MVTGDPRKSSGPPPESETGNLIPSARVDATTDARVDARIDATADATAGQASSGREPAVDVSLTRAVRFSIPFAPMPPSPERHNTFAGWPAVPGLAAFYEMRVACVGRPDPMSGYLMNISRIDAAVREHVIPLVERTAHATPGASAPRILRDALHLLRSALDDKVASVTWQLTPFYSLTMETRDMNRVLLRQEFSFAASHRLHCPGLDDAENRRIFGRCNNPSGHGHNYRIAVAVSVPVPDGDGARAEGFTLHDLERVVHETVIERFDHTHLNEDTEEFAGLNPSVEHITRVCYDLLRDPIARAGGRLEPVTVWETEKTSCTFPVLP